MKEIEIKYDKLLKESKDIEFKSLPYLKTYNHFIKYFKNKKKITEHDFIIGIHAIYGWMPTILKKLDLEDIDNTLIILNNVKNSKTILSKEDLLLLKLRINNSMVGVSKLLHFINPEKYAIWDSRVYRYMYDKTPTSQITSVKKYLEYISILNEIEVMDNDNKFYKNVCEKLDKQFKNEEFSKDITKKRTIELVMFELGKK